MSRPPGVLFSSYEFVLCFLPVVLAGYYLLRHRGRAAIGFLVLASLFFYGYWRPVYLLLLLPSVALNYAVGRRIARLRGQGRNAKPALIFGLALNLGALIYFKYAGLLVVSFNKLSGGDFHIGNVLLPLAISFFTFQQVAYLVDIYADRPYEADPLKYTFFVTFFPQLIAGPIVHHSELMPQLARNPRRKEIARNLALGLSFFTFGLFKKVVFADSMAVFADRIFNGLQHGVTLGAASAWFGASAYTLQLYFDFSGYSDMAIGLGAMFGLRLPHNFNSPYKAGSIKEFWRRWHMTLSRFLRDYLYIPLGGSRRGGTRQSLNLMATMFLGGLWHGAAWKFAVWGAIHGTYLTVQRLWESLLTRVGLSWLRSNLGYRGLMRTLTFVAVVLAWIPFRAPNMSSTVSVWKGMLGLRGLGELPRYATWQVGGVMLGLLMVVNFAPNTAQVFLKFRPAFETYSGEISRGIGSRLWSWRPTPLWGLVIALMWCAAFIMMSGVSPFIYYQF